MHPPSSCLACANIVGGAALKLTVSLTLGLRETAQVAGEAAARGDVEAVRLRCL